MTKSFETFASTLTSHPVRMIGLALLCAPYIVSGIDKLLDPSSGVDEMLSYGLTPAGPYSAVVTLIQLGCSTLVITGFGRWIGALILAVFTVCATLLADAFWNQRLGFRGPLAEPFFDHIALSGALLLVPWYTLHRYRTGREDDWT